MAKLILYSPFYKSGEKNMGGYAVYLATREGVELPKNTKLDLSATKKQQSLIDKILKDYPLSKELLEYSDYISKPTVGNASEYISRVLESITNDEGFGTYAKYMATRPGAEKIATHGLFSDTGKPIILSRVEKELNEYEGNVWTHIISLRREDAARLGFDNVKAWQLLLNASRDEIAKQMRIKPEHFKWYAAFHNEGHHPHVHMIAYSTNPNEAYLGKVGIRNIKSCLAKEIFKDDLLHIYKEQTQYRDEIKIRAEDIADKIISDLHNGLPENDLICRLLFELNGKLKTIKGKKVYGYLKPELKLLVDSIVDELEKDEHIKQLYNLWYAEKDKIVSNYTNEKLKRNPLSQNKEFKSIRNMIIRQALQLDDLVMAFDDDETDEPFIFSEDETEFEPPDDIPDEYYSLNSFEKYRLAKEFLDETSVEYNPERGLSLMWEAAEDGNSFAQYRLGKILVQGIICEKDITSGLYWLEKSANQDNEWAEYYLGKQYLGNGDIERNCKRSIYLLKNACKQGNRFAQYTLACQYLFSEEYTDKQISAVRLLELSAKQNFAPAEKMLAFMLIKGELIPNDDVRASRLLEHSVQLGDDKAQYALAKLLLKSDTVTKDSERAVKLLYSASQSGNEWAQLLLGKMLLFGKEIPKNEKEGLYFLKASAEQGNIYATAILQNRDDYMRMLAVTSLIRLIGYACNLFYRKLDDDKQKSNMRMGRKKKRKLMDKKIAMRFRE